MSANKFEVNSIISKLTAGIDPDDYQESLEKQRIKLGLALQLSQDETYQDGEYHLALVKAQRSARVKRAMRASAIEDKIQSRLDEAKAVKALSQVDQVLLGKVKVAKVAKGKVKVAKGKGKGKGNGKVTVEPAPLPQ